MDLTEQHITQYTVDGNTTARGGRGYNSALVVRIQRFGVDSESWYLTSGETVFNHASGAWDPDHEFRHADDRNRYLTGLHEAAYRVDAALAQLRAEYSRT